MNKCSVIPSRKVRQRETVNPRLSCWEGRKGTERHGLLQLSVRSVR
jgi:hypothetical protein